MLGKHWAVGTALSGTAGWRYADSNRGPLDCQSNALAN